MFEKCNGEVDENVDMKEGGLVLWWGAKKTMGVNCIVRN